MSSTSLLYFMLNKLFHAKKNFFLNRLCSSLFINISFPLSFSFAFSISNANHIKDPKMKHSYALLQKWLFRLKTKAWQPLSSLDFRLVSYTQITSSISTYEILFWQFSENAATACVLCCKRKVPSTRTTIKIYMQMLFGGECGFAYSHNLTCSALTNA